MITLGIETSCDDTALAIIETRQMTGKSADLNATGKLEGLNGVQNTECRVISSLVHSQAELHSAYGGVYPNLAKREHGKNLVPLLHKLLADYPNTSKTPNIISPEKFAEILSHFKSDLEAQNPDLWLSISGADFLRSIPAIDRIAVTEGPGLEPALWVGIIFARVLGALWNIPIVAVNHMEGHILGSLLESDKATGTWHKLKPLEFPALALLISGGHTELVRIDEQIYYVPASDGANFRPNDVEMNSLVYTILGQTLDDAVGEAFDKVARLLGLPYPGGPHISKLSEEASELMTPSPVKLPRPMMKSDNLNFSFSGLKTAVLYAVRAAVQPDGRLTDEFKRGLAHEFELAVTETLDWKLRRAIEQIGAKTVIVGGGVSANSMLRERFTKVAEKYDIPIYLPSRHISGDNALMIALAGAMDPSEPYSNTDSKPLKADGTKKLGRK